MNDRDRTKEMEMEETIKSYVTQKDGNILKERRETVFRKYKIDSLYVIKY